MNPASALKLARPNWANLHAYRKDKNSMPVQKWYRGNILTAYEPLTPIFLDDDLKNRCSPSVKTKPNYLKILKTVQLKPVKQICLWQYGKKIFVIQKQMSLYIFQNMALHTALYAWLHWIYLNLIS